MKDNTPTPYSTFVTPRKAKVWRSNLDNENPNGLSGIYGIKDCPCMKNREPIHNEPRFTEARAALEIR